MPQFWLYPFVPTPNFEGGVRGLLEPTNITGPWTVYWDRAPKHKKFGKFNIKNCDYNN